MLAHVYLLPLSEISESQTLLQTMSNLQILKRAFLRASADCALFFFVNLDARACLPRRVRPLVGPDLESATGQNTMTRLAEDCRCNVLLLIACARSHRQRPFHFPARLLLAIRIRRC